MRLPINAVCLGWIALVVSSSPAQNIPTPSSQSLCDMPSSTPLYAKYCGKGAAGSSVPAGPTPQQQMGLALGQAAAPYLQQGIHNFLYGKPAPPPDPAREQRKLAAQQLNNSGIFLLQQKNYSGAINEFQQALLKAPNDTNIVHNLALAKQLRQNATVAAQTSDTLSAFVGTAPASMGHLDVNQLTHAALTNPNAFALNLVIHGTDGNVVDLRDATRASPESLQSQIDALLMNGTPISPAPDSRLVLPEARDIELLFEPPQATLSPLPTNSERQTKAQVGRQMDAIFAEPGGLDDMLEKGATGGTAKTPSILPQK